MDKKRIRKQKHPWGHGQEENLVDVDRGHHRGLEGDMLDQIGGLDKGLEPRVGGRLGRNVLLLRLGLRHARRELGELRLVRRGRRSRRGRRARREKTDSPSELELPDDVDDWKGEGAYADPGRGANWGTGAW